MQDKNLNEFLNLFEKLAIRFGKTNEFIIWLEEHIYKIGKEIYLNNLPDLIDELKNKDPIVLILKEKTIFNEYIKNGFNNIYINFQEDLSNEIERKLNLLPKFVSIVLNNLKKKNSTHFIINFSFSKFLLSNQVNLNLYNFKSSNDFLYFTNLHQILTNNGFEIINNDEHNQIINNLSFIDPISKQISQFVRNKAGVFDIHFGFGYNIDSIKQVLNLIQEKLLVIIDR
ncbi:MAG: hypothetical protein ACTSVV_06660 [Promethearchaeota archaeon]